MASNDMVRILVSDHLERPLGDIDPTQVSELTEVAQVNGEHALTIVTTQELEKTNRLLIRDAMGLWHEYVVLGIQSERQEDGALWHEYYATWSLQYDLSATFIDDMYGCGVRPGQSSEPQTPRRGLECALEGTSRWAIGSITVTTMAAASFYRRSGWEGLQTVVEKWGGELRATITVDALGLVSRAVDLLAHEGSAEAVRRFDYGYDLTGIKRTVSDDIWPCRIVPLGASQETEAGGYTRRPSIESVNGGVMWLQDDDAVPLTRVPDGAGGWEYPTAIIKNDTYEEPADLKAWALEHITEYTRPIVSYEATVAQLTQAGMDTHGVALGDEVVVVDRAFGADGLRLEARVLKVKQSLLDPTQTELTIGNLNPSLGGEITSIERQVTDLAATVENGSSFISSTEWVQHLLGRINTDINATGGFTYITEGQGIRTYDVAVTDPLVGAEANSVVEIKGGTVRIANTKDAQGQWEWKTIFTSGYVNAEVIRAIGLLSGSHVEVDANGVHIYDQNGTEVALYAPTVRIGATTDGNYITVDADSLDVYHGGTNMATFGQTTRIGPSNGTRVVVSGSTVQIIPENRARNALTFGANADDDYAYISYGTDWLQIGPLEIDKDCDLEVPEVWINDSLSIGHSASYGYPMFTVDGSTGVVSAASGIFAMDNPSDTSDPPPVVGLTGSGSYIDLKAGRGTAGNRWRFSKSNQTIWWYDGSAWDPVCPMPAMTAAISGQTDKNLTVAYANLTLAAVTTVGSTLTISGGGIKCAKAGRVMISASAYFGGVSNGNVCNVRALIGSTVAAQASDRANSDRCHLAIPPRITTVAAGDVIYMAVANTSAATGSVEGTRTQTWMTVQYVAYN